MTEDQKLKTRRVVELIGKLFISRKDVKAIETPKGWMPDRDRAPRGTAASDMPCHPLVMNDFYEHLFGKRCLGTYLLNSDNNVKFFAIDVDLKTENSLMFAVPDLNDWEHAYQAFRDDNEKIVGILDLDKMYLGDLEAALHNPGHVGHRWARLSLRLRAEAIAHQVKEQLGLRPMIVITGGGAHVLVPLGSLTPAIEARAMANTVMTAGNYEMYKGDCFWRMPGATQDGIEIEVFPKQDSLSGGQSFGNLLRLPMGWHAQAKIRTWFLDPAPLGTLPPWELPKANAIQELELAAAAVGVG